MAGARHNLPPIAQNVRSGSNPAIWRCRLNVRFARERTWLGDYEYRLATPSDGASLNSAERACLERAADPLHRAGVYSKLFGNDPYTWPSRTRQSLTDSFLQCGGDWRPAEAFTLTPGPREASADSFHEQMSTTLFWGEPGRSAKGDCPGGLGALREKLHCIGTKATASNSN